MNQDLIIKKTKKTLENNKLSPAEKTLLLRLFFRYGLDEFEAKIQSMAKEFGMNQSTLISNLTRLKRAGLLKTKPVYSDNGGGRCGTAIQLGKF